MASEHDNVTKGDEVKIRVEDDLLRVALNSAEFDRAARKFLPDEAGEEDIELLEMLMIHRGELPRHGGVWVEWAWWVGGMLCLAIFGYGCFCLILKVALIFGSLVAPGPDLEITVLKSVPTGVSFFGPGCLDCPPATQNL